MNVLSLFDGLSCGMIALERAGIQVTNYYASEIDKHATKVSEHNYPNIIRLGDVTKVSYKDGVLYSENGQWNVGKIDLLLAGSPCFIAGTTVITSVGIKSIEEVQIGDVVLTHSNAWKNVLRVGGKITTDTYKLKAQGILPTTTTSEHPYYVRECKRYGKKSVRMFSEPMWKPVKELCIGDYIGIPIIQEQENPHNITEDDAFILGRYIADGHTAKNYRMSKGEATGRVWGLYLSIGSHKLQAFKEKITSGYSCFEHTKGVSRVVFSRKRLVELAEKLCGCGAENKEIHPDLLKLPNNMLRALLEGILSGDGSERNGEFRVTSISRKLIESMQIALAKVYGVIGSVEYTRRPPTTVIEGRTVNQKDTYTISFRKEVKKQSHFRQIDNHIWTPVKSLKYMGEEMQVFNLEVEGDNSYTANNAIVHNCQGFSLAGKQLAFDDERSKLYFEFERILKEVNPTYFILENVKMKQEYKDVISDRLGVQPIAINSNLVSAQNRYRLYWTNIQGIQQPKDLGIVLTDILIDKESLSDDIMISVAGVEYMDNEVADGRTHWQFLHHSDTLDDKSRCITAAISKCVPYNVLIDRRGNKCSMYDCDFQDDADVCNNCNECDSFQSKHIATKTIRKFHPIEIERLQTVPDNYTCCVSNTQRYKMLGNGWTVDVIAHILKGIQT